jgi:hypothetical protein
MIRSRGANVSATTDDLRYFYEMGYFYGRNDALDGRPYDARLPHERVEITDSTGPRGETRTSCSPAQCTRTDPA